MYCDRLFDFLFLPKRNGVGSERERDMNEAGLGEKPETKWMLKKTYIKKYNL